MYILSLQTTKKAIFLHILSDFRTKLYAISKLYFIKIISPLTMGLSKRWQFLPEHDFWLHEQFHDDYEWSNFLQRSMEFLILKIPWKKSINLFWIFKFFREIMFACFFTCEIFLTSQTYGIQIRSSVRSKIAVAFIHVKLEITGILENIIKIGGATVPIISRHIYNYLPIAGFFDRWTISSFQCVFCSHNQIFLGKLFWHRICWLLISVVVNG